MTYQSPYDARGVDSWHRRALVRNKARLAFNTPLADGDQLYNAALTAYAEHPLVVARDAGATRRLRALRLADYLAKTEEVEVRIVNDAVAAILARDDLPEAMRLDLLKIYTDEGYHVLMVAEFRETFQATTGLALARRPSEDLERILAILRELPEADRALGLVLSATVTETLITSTLRQSSDRQLYPPVAEMLADHGQDESMHHAFFVRFAEFLVPRLTARERALAETLVPRFMGLFLSPGLATLRRDLAALGLGEDEVRRVLDESFDLELWKNLFIASSTATRALFTRLGFDCVARFEAAVLAAWPSQLHTATGIFE